MARFFEFTIARYQGDIYAFTGVVVAQPVDEFNRPASTWTHAVRVPPSDEEVEHLFTSWADALRRSAQVPDRGTRLHGRFAVATGRAAAQRVA